MCYKKAISDPFRVSYNGLQPCEGKVLEPQNFNVKNKFQMKQKFSIKRLAFAFASMLLCAVFTSCGTTHIEFTIQWAEFWKTIGLIVLGALIVIAILLYLFRHFRIW